MTYLARAGCGQMEILWKREPIRDVIADPATGTEERAKLLHVERVREFARRELGLRVEDTYTSYSRLDREAIAWNVSASRELALEPKTWWFPIVGRVPYLGFFTKEEAEDLRAELEAEGWDVIVSTVAAYSTLGWFDDPLVSPQLQSSEWWLASLVIHESAHATVWFPGDVRFNESFASFVETEGALQFYRQTFGPDSEEYRSRIRLLLEAKEYSLILRRYAEKLNHLYAADDPEERKRVGKRRLLEELRTELLRRAPEFRELNLRKRAEREFNNAHFLSHLRYRSGSDFFQTRFEACERRWSCFLESMQKLEGLDAADRRKLWNESGP